MPKIVFRESDSDEEFETEVFRKQVPDSRNLDDERNQTLAAEDSDSSAEQEQLFAESDGEEGPDDITFTNTKQSALEQMKSAMKQIDENRKNKKAKRRQIDQQYKEQKRLKLQDLAKARLPQDFLEALPENISKTTVEKSTKKSQESPLKSRKSATDAPVSDDDTDEDDASDMDSSEDFIPLDNDRCAGIKVMSLKEEKKSISVGAADFRQNQLYGGRVPRESTKAKIAKIEKRKARFR